MSDGFVGHQQNSTIDASRAWSLPETKCLDTKVSLADDCRLTTTRQAEADHLQMSTVQSNIGYDNRSVRR
jgi:hypothetical protein